MGSFSVQDKAAIPGRGVFRASKLPSSPPPEKKKRVKITLPRIHVPLNKKTLVISGIVGLLVAGGGAVGWYEYNLQQSPAVIFAKRLHTMTEQVSKYVALPKDEDPVTATVTDPTVLPHEAFFKNAQTGDKILMYKKHKLAILYRPGTGQVITQAKLDFRDVTPTPTPGYAAVAGASTSAYVTVTPAPTIVYHPQGKILVMPQ